MAHPTPPFLLSAVVLAALLVSHASCAPPPRRIYPTTVPVSCNSPYNPIDDLTATNHALPAPNPPPSATLMQAFATYLTHTFISVIDSSIGASTATATATATVTATPRPLSKNPPPVDQRTDTPVPVSTSLSIRVKYSISFHWRRLRHNTANAIQTLISPRPKVSVASRTTATAATALDDVIPTLVVAHNKLLYASLTHYPRIIRVPLYLFYRHTPSLRYVLSNSLPPHSAAAAANPVFRDALAILREHFSHNGHAAQLADQLTDIIGIPEIVTPTPTPQPDFDVNREAVAPSRTFRIAHLTKDVVQRIRSMRFYMSKVTWRECWRSRIDITFYVHEVRIYMWDVLDRLDKFTHKALQVLARCIRRVSHSVRLLGPAFLSQVNRKWTDFVKPWLKQSVLWSFVGVLWGLLVILLEVAHLGVLVSMSTGIVVPFTLVLGWVLWNRRPTQPTQRRQTADREGRRASIQPRWRDARASLLAGESVMFPTLPDHAGIERMEVVSGNRRDEARADREERDGTNSGRRRQKDEVVESVRRSREHTKRLERLVRGMPSESERLGRGARMGEGNDENVGLEVEDRLREVIDLVSSNNNNNNTPRSSMAAAQRERMLRPRENRIPARETADVRDRARARKVKAVAAGGKAAGRRSVGKRTIVTRQRGRRLVGDSSTEDD